MRKRTSAEQRAIAHYARALQCGSDTDYSAAQWEMLCVWFGGCCLSCGATPVTVDHVVPLGMGGTNTLVNLQPLCDACNKRKGSRTVDYRNVCRLVQFLEGLR